MSSGRAGDRPEGTTPRQTWCPGQWLAGWGVAVVWLWLLDSRLLVVAGQACHSDSGWVPGLRQDARRGIRFALGDGGWGRRLDAGGGAERGGVAGGPRNLIAGWDGALGDGLADLPVQDLAQVHGIGVPGGERGQPEGGLDHPQRGGVLERAAMRDP